MNEFRIFAHGETFDVDAFLAATTLHPDRIWHRGDERHDWLDSRYSSSGVEFMLGDGRVVPLSEQERMAIAYLEAHRDELRRLGEFPGADTFILGLQYVSEFDESLVGFSMGPSLLLMRHSLDIGIRPHYYAILEDHRNRQREDSDPEAAVDT